MTRWAYGKTPGRLRVPEDGRKLQVLRLERIEFETSMTNHSNHHINPVSFASSNSANHEGRFLLCIVLIALAVRLVVVAFVYPGFLAPGRDHWEFGFESGKIARSIVLGHGFGNPYYGGDTGPTAEMSPVFPYIVAGVLSVFGIYTKSAALAMLSLNSLFSAVTCVPIFFVAKKSLGFREARWAAWTWALFPYAIEYSAHSMWDHALVALLLTWIFWAVLHLQESPHIWAWAGFGLLCGFTALTNPIVLGVVPFLAGWACYRLHNGRKTWLLPAATAALLAGAVIAPWLVRNYRTFHQPVFLKDGFPLAFLAGNAGNALHWWNGLVDPSGNAVEMDEFHRVGEQEYMAAKWVQVRAFLANNSGAFVWRSVRRFFYMWTGYWSFDREYLREEPFDPENIPFCTAVTALALIGLWKFFRRDVGLATLYALLLAVFPLVYYLTHPDIAYRHPLDPEVVILACSAVVARRSSSQREVAENPQQAVVAS